MYKLIHPHNNPISQMKRLIHKETMWLKVRIIELLNGIIWTRKYGFRICLLSLCRTALSFRLKIIFHQSCEGNSPFFLASSVVTEMSDRPLILEPLYVTCLFFLETFGIFTLFSCGVLKFHRVISLYWSFKSTLCWHLVSPLNLGICCYIFGI